MVDVSETIQLFAGLTGEEREQIASCCDTATFATGEQLFAAGEAARSLYIVRSGRVELRFDVQCYSATVEFTLDVKTAGDLLGWSAMLPAGHYTLGAKATEPTELLQIDTEELRRHCDANPRLGYVIMRNLVHIIGGRYELVRLTLEREIQSGLASKDPLA